MERSIFLDAAFAAAGITFIAFILSKGLAVLLGS